MNLKTVTTLIIARNKEFYRDKGSVTWAILFPLLLMVGITFAFKNQNVELFKIGVLGEKNSIDALAIAHRPWITVVSYPVAGIEADKALDKVRHHQLDLLLKQQDDGVHYWINPESSRGEAAEQLLLTPDKSSANDQTIALHKEVVTGRAIRYIDWVIPGILGMNIMFGALFGIGYVIVRYRKMEVLKRVQATPVSALEYLTAQVVSRLLIMLTVCVLIFAGCNSVLHFVMQGSYLLLFLVAALGGFAMVSLGLVIASRTDNEELAGGLLNIATFPMMLLSEVWFSLDGAPSWMITLSKFMPLTHMVAAARQVMLEGATLSEISLHLWFLACMSVIMLVAASLMFRWTKQ
jgi:ABC-type multidrug transport system permease subunit